MVSEGYKYFEGYFICYLTRYIYIKTGFNILFGRILNLKSAFNDLRRSTTITAITTTTIFPLLLPHQSGGRHWDLPLFVMDTAISEAAAQEEDIVNLVSKWEEEQKPQLTRSASKLKHSCGNFIFQILGKKKATVHSSRS